MKRKNLITEQTIFINAGATAVWQVLTDPAIIRQYLFGSELVTDWKPGSAITLSRNTNGTTYTDKGEILAYDQGKFLKYSYWSSQEGYPDLPENYSVISYGLEKENMGISFTYRRENIPLEFEQKNQERFLPMMLQAIKKLAEEANGCPSQ